MNGIIPVWKEKKMTSHDVVFKLRKILHMKKIGHTGTLDPEVEGVLPICIGRATKIAEYMTNEDKEYVAEVMIGKSTTTEDASGEVIAEKPIRGSITKEELQTILAKHKGKMTQIPPMYSAIKVNGKKLYEYARKGEIIERPKREVTIHKMAILSNQFPLTKENPCFRIQIRCSKGTYIRTLAVMIGNRLGYPAHMSRLERTKSVFFSKPDCFTLAEISDKVAVDDFSFIKPIEEGIRSFKQIEVDQTIVKKVLNGMRLHEKELGFFKESHVAILFEGKLVAIYKPHPTRESYYKPEKVIMLLHDKTLKK